MIEIRIHGRGGQGGITLAKLIATARHLLGESVQAFGVYAAERSGAPLQAFCRYDSNPIANRNLIYEPDHVVVLDPTLVSLGVTKGLKSGGWILINTPESATIYQEKFPGYRVATVDATNIARKNKLGTASVPIVNTALVGAVARILDFDLEDVNNALGHVGFVNGNLAAAEEAYERVQTSEAVGTAEVEKPVIRTDFIPGLVDGNTGELPRIRTGDWAAQKPIHHYHRFVPPCNYACPAGNDVQGFLAALADGKTDEALEILLRTTPFPSVCGRVCPAPCMDVCNRVQLDGAVNVRDLERWAGDHGNVEILPKEHRSESVAVIGSGPAGLSAVYHLKRLGYNVTLYEHGPELGGLLRTGIPAYRLPREDLDREINRILDLGVSVETDHHVDKPELLAIAQQHDALLVATGLQQLRAMKLGAGDDGTVMQGIEFLDLANRQQIRVDDEDVVVVGGGNTAFDSARSALRLGATSVRIVYRRTREEMPAIREEIDQGIEEGIQVDFLTLPVKISPNAAGEGFTLTCRPMQLAEPDESGRRRPVEIQGRDFDLRCDRVLLALGQSPALSIFPEGTEVCENENLIGLLQTPVFALGDLAANEGTVTAAIGSGRRAAFHIHNTFTGEPLLPPAHDELEVADLESLSPHLFAREDPDEGQTLPPLERRHSYDEVHTGLASAEEANRCMSCGVCNECDKCVIYCPDGVITRRGSKFIFDYDYCKGCGVCAIECPRNIIFMNRL